MKSSFNKGFCTGCNRSFSTTAGKNHHKCLLHQHPSGATCAVLIDTLVNGDTLKIALDQMPLPTRGRPATITDATWRSRPVILGLTPRRSGARYSIKALLAAQLTLDIAAQCQHGTGCRSTFHAPMLIAIKAIFDTQTHEFTRVEIEAVMPDRPLSGSVWLPINWQSTPELCFLANDADALPVRRPFESVDQLATCLAQFGINVTKLARSPARRPRLIRTHQTGTSLIAHWQLLCSPLASKFFNSQAS